MKSWARMLAMVACLGCAGSKATPATTAALTGRELAPEERMLRARASYEASEYQAAEKAFARLASEPDPKLAAKAELGLATLYVTIGRPLDAIRHAEAAVKRDPSVALSATEARANALRLSGKLTDAEALLAPFAGRADAPALRLALGEVLLETGRRKQAEPVLMSLVEDYNDQRIAENDGPGLARAARAAWLLRYPRDANTLFDEAEQATPGNTQTLLWRAELFLEKYDTGHAEEVLRELLEKAPRQPLALTLLARVRLDQALDFDEAERLARAALAQNPGLGIAHFVLAGIALRDMELDVAEQRIQDGLVHNPRELSLRALRVTTRFLADDPAGFEREKRSLLELNPEYSELYAILAEFADWEHRYDEIVSLTREALGIDAADAAALSQLGFNLIRSGQDAEGVSTLQKAFKLDPYNVRVFNTLNLYETVIPKAYVSISAAPFNVRLHKDDRAVLERYVPGLLHRAWNSMSRAYEFTPSTPVGVEIYAERESFAIRTSGLPQTAIQGVCFGRTLASMSPQREAFNLGMTLWHELSHVFHIQLSKSRVPRWFTEGLAEYETAIERPEWTREHDPELYSMSKRGKLPAVARMSRAFTRAEDIEDVATAYYASSQIVGLLARRTGRGTMAKMLRAWGEGKRGEDVFRSVLAQSSSDVDREFRAELDRRFERYARQFVPETHARPLATLKALVADSPRDADLAYELAMARLRSGDADGAAKQAERALSLAPNHAQARYLLARVAMAANDAKKSEALLQTMLKQGQQGYAVYLALGEIARARDDVASARASFELAHAADPSQTEPLSALADLAAAEKVADDEVRQLEKLALLSEHQPLVHRRLLSKLIELRRYPDAVRAAEAALWADIDGLSTHVLFAEALAATGNNERARFELETATLCRGDAADRAEAHARLAELLVKLRRPKEARRELERARELDPKNVRAQNLKL